jgi:hypothetical protein
MVLALRPREKDAYRFLFWFVLGEVAAGLATGLFLVGYGSVSGFWEWGVRYAFGPYATTKWPVAQRLMHTLDWSVWSPALILAIAGAAALLPRLAARRERPSWQGPAVFLVLALLVLGTVLFQGKTHCRYQFHPFYWALALAGAAALQAAAGRNVPVVSGRASGALCLSLLAMLTYDNTYRRVLWTPDGYSLAEQLRPQLGGSDQFVLFGFSPTFHSQIERPTPFPFVDGWIVLTCSGDAAHDRIERTIGQSLASSVRRPRVRCFIVQRHLTCRTSGKTHTIEGVVAKYVPDRDLAALGYSRSTIAMPCGTQYDVWMRSPPKRG